MPYENLVESPRYGDVFRGQRGVWRRVRGRNVFIAADGTVAAGPKWMRGEKVSARIVAAKKPTMRPGFREASPEDRKRWKVPGAWTDVVVAESDDAELVAIGRDAAGRIQYRYSAARLDKSTAEKFARAKKFHEALPRIEKKLAVDAKRGIQEELMLRLIAKTGMRVGGDENRGKVQAYGASTIKMSHVRVRGDRVDFEFVGKKGVLQKMTVVDPLLAQLVADRSGEDALFDTSAAKVRAYLKQSGDFLIKDFRTAVANQTALAEIKKLGHPENAAEAAKWRRHVAKVVSDKLGNTPEVALDSYINPLVFNGWPL